jgi:hypothetical protein
MRIIKIIMGVQYLNYMTSAKQLETSTSSLQLVIKQLGCCSNNNNNNNNNNNSLITQNNNYKQICSLLKPTNYLLDGDESDNMFSQPKKKKSE